MRKLFFLLALAILMLSACNMDDTYNPPSEETPSPQVQQTEQEHQRELERQAEDDAATQAAIDALMSVVVN
jgi:outer membrane biogenesis lipoprotein LolB